MELEYFKRMYDHIDMELIFFEDIIPIAQDDFNGKILLTDGEIDCPDFVFVRAFDLGEKQYHLNAVLEMFKAMDVYCINDVDTKRITSDKLLSMQVGSSVFDLIKTPKTILVTPDISASRIGEILGFPVVIKIMHGSKANGVLLIETEKELDNLLSIIFAAPFDDQIMAQEAILSSKGRDIRLMFAFGKLIISYVRINEGSFTSNLATGGYAEECEIPEEIVNDALKFIEAIDLKFGSIDLLFGENENEFYFCEANSTIGMIGIVNAFEEGDEEYLARFKDFPF